MPPIEEAAVSVREHPFLWGLLPHLLTVVGVLLALLALARLLRERRQPGNTYAWLLAIVLVPYVGVPLYLIFGGRKLRRLVARKQRLPAAQPEVVPMGLPPLARVLTHNGVGPPAGGNRVRFIASGEEMFAELEARIRAAKHTIYIMTFILGRDAVGRRLVKLLAERAREGVRVRLLLDALGCFSTSRGFCEPLRRAGGEVARFMPVLPLQTRGSANLRNHRKIAVFDGHAALIGGHNLALAYLGPVPRRRRWRDFGARVEGPAVRQLEEIFRADWEFATEKEWPKAPTHSAPAVAGSSELQVVASGPDVAGDPLYEGILAMVQHAQRSLWIVTPYFIPDEVLQRSLLIQARAGVEIKLVVPARSNHRIADLARRHFLHELREAGVQVLLYGPGMNHAKAIVMDDEAGLWGSANLDARSLFVNFEVGVVTYAQADVAAMRDWMREVMTHTQPLVAPTGPRRFVSAAAEEISRLLAPLL